MLRQPCLRTYQTLSSEMLFFRSDSPRFDFLRTFLSLTSCVLHSSLFAVETLSLSKRYGKTDALRELNFTVDEGEIMVILGPNGSGKTTLLMTLCTILKPTSGTAKVMGIDVVKDGTKVREVMGIAFQEARGFWRHKPSSILKFHASMFDIDPVKRQDLIEQTMKELELWGVKRQTVHAPFWWPGEETGDSEGLGPETETGHFR